MKLGPFIVGAALLASTGGAMAGVAVNGTETWVASGQTQALAIVIDDERLKVTTQDHILIYRADLERMWMIETSQKTYVELSPEKVRSFDAFAAKAQGALAEYQARLKEQLARLPAAQRPMMEQMLVARGLGGLIGDSPVPPAPPPPQVSIAKAGGGKTVAGLPCENYDKTENGQKSDEICVAPMRGGGFSQGDFQMLDRMWSFVGSDNPMYPQMMFSTMLRLNDFLRWNGMDNLLGFPAIPLETTSYYQGRPVVHQILTSVEHRAIPAGEFELPAGLTKRELFTSPP